MIFIQLSSIVRPYPSLSLMEYIMDLDILKVWLQLSHVFKCAVFFHFFAGKVANHFHIKIFELEEENNEVTTCTFRHQSAVMQKNEFLFFFVEQDKIR